MSWGKKLAQIWINYVPPARPSYAELCIYTEYLREIQKSLKRRVELLILGSTAEFRDWGFEQFLNVTVIDYSYDYYLESGRGTKHKNLNERMVHKRWQDMDFENKFDVIIGDMVIGNLPPHDVQNFLERASQALTKNGLFMTKSVFKNGKKTPNIEELLKDYYSLHSHHHPLTKMLYGLLLTCRDPHQELLNFQKLWGKLEKAHKSGFLKSETMEIFSKLGWKDIVKFQFNIPDFDNWENMIKKSFNGFKKEYCGDVYSQNIPVYIIYNS